MELPFDPVIPLLGIYPKKLETPIRKDICIPMFIMAQFTIDRFRYSLNAHEQMSGLKNCGTFTQWNTMLL